MLYNSVVVKNSSARMALSEDKLALRIVSNQSVESGALNVLRQAAKARTEIPEIQFVTVAYPNLDYFARKKIQEELRMIYKGLSCEVKFNVLLTEESTERQVQMMTDLEV